MDELGGGDTRLRGGGAAPSGAQREMIYARASTLHDDDEKLLPTACPQSDGDTHHVVLVKESVEERTALSDPNLLRGAPFPVVVAGLGRHLEPTGTIAASAGAHATEDTFALSHPVKMIDHFLSHSWRDGAKLKWLSLLWYVNLPFAVAAGHVAAALSFAAILMWPEVYPATPIAVGDIFLLNGPSPAIGLWVFLVALGFGHYVSGAAPELFLDKICIHQTDPKLKAAGIQALGAYLRNSKHMLVLWGDDYFDRLWCCYEMSLYILLQDVEKINILPIAYAGQSILIFAMFAVSMTAAVALELLGNAEMSGIGNLLLMTEMLLFFSPLALFGWYKADVYEARISLRSKLSVFDIRSVQCFCCQAKHVLPNGESIPCDRRFVEEGISLWFGKDGREGLSAFNHVMRTQLNASIAALLGKETVMPLPQMLVLGSLLAWVSPGNVFLTPKPLINNICFAFDAVWLPAALVLADSTAGVAMQAMHRCNFPWLRLCTALVYMIILVPAFSPDLVLQDPTLSFLTKVIVFVGFCGSALLVRMVSK